MPRTLPTQYSRSVRTTLDSSFSAYENQREDRDDRELGGIESEHAGPGRLTSFVVPRRRDARLGGTRCHIDGVLAQAFLARKLARGFVAVLLVILAILIVLVVGHALLQFFRPLATSPIIELVLFPAKDTSRMIARIRI